MNSFKFKVAYSLEGTESLFLSKASTEAEAKKELKQWVHDTFPFLFVKPKVLYVVKLEPVKESS